MSFDLRGIEVQYRTRAQRKVGFEGETLTFGFHIGPHAVSCICNLPTDDGEWDSPPLARIKTSLEPDYDWKAFGEQRIQIRNTAEGMALIFGFRFSPLAIFCIANLPEKEGEFRDLPLVYVKMSIEPDNDWRVFREHLVSGDGNVMLRIAKD
jgi:hypothetical protein